jgi:hypothetical protein
MDENRYILTGSHNTTYWSTKNARNDKNELRYGSKSKYYQHKWKKDILLAEKIIICETVFCGLATRSVKIVTEMPHAQNSIRYRAVIDRN